MFLIWFNIVDKMKIIKLIIIYWTIIIPTNVWGQATKTVPPKNNMNYEARIDSLLLEIDTLLMINNQLLDKLDIDLSLKNRFKLYNTENLYTLLQLDTKTGKIDQVQWSLESDNEGSIAINSDDLSFGYGYGSGSFELYPTSNMYQFILLDKTDGRKWHVQWGIGESKRWIRRIY